VSEHSGNELPSASGPLAGPLSGAGIAGLSGAVATSTIPVLTRSNAASMSRIAASVSRASPYAMAAASPCATSADRRMTTRCVNVSFIASTRW